MIQTQTTQPPPTMTEEEQKELNEKLIKTAQMRCADKIQALVEAGANCNATDKDGWTPLHYAAERDDEECIVALLAAGADLSIKDNEGHTPFHLAVINLSVSAAQALRKAGCCALIDLSDGDLDHMGASIVDRVEEYMLAIEDEDME